MMYGTQPGRWHNTALCWWQFYDWRGQLVAVISDEAIECTPEARYGWKL